MVRGGGGGIRPSSSSAPYSPCRTPATSSPRRQPTSPTAMPDVAAALHLSLLLPPAPSSPSSSSSLPTGFKLPHCSVSISPYFSRKVALWRRPVVLQARYGGGRSGDLRQGDFEQDSALDISSIRSPSVRLIDATQNMVGVVSKNEAIRMAEDSELDLVVLSPDADPPVVRIMDYKKYRYEQQKKKRDQQKKSAASRMDMKELKMGYNIDSHDYSVRLRAAQKFLKDGDKVKVIVNLKGRENEFRNIAIELIKRFQDDVGELATEERKNFRERNIYIVLVPNKTIQQKASQEQAKKTEKTATEATTTV